jgi:hypothetical protein
MWRLPQTRGYSYPRVAAIRIDVHPVGETRSTRHTHSTALEKKGFRHNPQHADWPIHRFVPNFSPESTNEAVGAKSTFCWWPTTRLTGLISLACNRYVQYLLARANPSVLNRDRRGLQPWRWRFCTYHSPAFPTSSLHFSPKGLVRSPVKSYSTNKAKV